MFNVSKICSFLEEDAYDCILNEIFSSWLFYIFENLFSRGQVLLKQVNQKTQIKLLNGGIHNEKINSSKNNIES